MRSRASDSRLWIGRRRLRETSRRQFESARGYPSYVARIGNAFGKPGNRQGWRPTNLQLPDLTLGLCPPTKTFGRFLARGFPGHDENDVSVHGRLEIPDGRGRGLRTRG